MPRKYLLLLSVALGVIFLDQWTKYLVVRELTTRFDDKPTVGERLSAMYGEPPPKGFDGLHYRSKRYIDVVPVFRLRYAENPGAAWGMFRSMPTDLRVPLFHVVSIGAVVLISWYFSRLSGKDPRERWAYYGLPLVLGGAIGNYIDRLARAFVIDFLEAHWYDKAYFPSFNVADSAICVGVGMLIIDSFVRRETPKAEEKSAEARP